jgi:hemerythrin-like domain-containing protein
MHALACFVHRRAVMKNTMAPAAGDERSFASTATLLRAEHARLEVIYERLLDAYREGSWPDVGAEWERFEPALRAHMDLEERYVFPIFREADPEEADHLLRDHDRLRRRLEVLGVNVELHAVTPFDAEELIEHLRTHRAREERLLYPWMDREPG